MELEGAELRRRSTRADTHGAGVGVRTRRVARGRCKLGPGRASRVAARAGPPLALRHTADIPLSRIARSGRRAPAAALRVAHTRDVARRSRVGVHRRALREDRDRAECRMALDYCI